MIDNTSKPVIADYVQRLIVSAGNHIGTMPVSTIKPYAQYNIFIKEKFIGSVRAYNSHVIIYEAWSFSEYMILTSDPEFGVKLTNYIRALADVHI